MNAVVGRRPETVEMEPFRFDQMRRGCYDVDARVHDMDLAGIWASLSFPSMITGFCGRVYSQCSDPDLGLATTRAFNDWVHDAWWQPHPDRIIPLGITWLSDPAEGAAEIRRNAARGFRAVTLPERPHRIGYPSIFDEYWAPILQACAETGTVVCLHVGSSGIGDIPPGCDRAIVPLVATLFGQLSLQACTEWLWAGWTVRFPGLRVAMAEGGIGWVAMLLDRLDNLVDRSGYGVGWDERPADVLRRDFWFCTIDDPSTIDTRHAIGLDHIMVEVDYPHGDSTWPDTQAVIEAAWGHLPAAERRKLCCENAAALFRHPLPERVLPEGPST
jgi:predicted TIM-barrel fold metal-dependent hydrolase